MFFNKIVGCAAVLATAVVASPVNIESRAVSKPFRLVTKSANPAHNGLYVESYHTGAGTSDPVLTTSSADSPTWILNDTYVTAELGSTPFGFDMYPPINYANWESVTINAGQGSSGFSINGTNLVWSPEDYFTGWLACNWWHANNPQLFWLYGEEGQTTLPCSCSIVELKVEYTS